MQLRHEELVELAEDILQELPDKIFEALSKANRCGYLEDLLEKLCLQDLLSPSEKIRALPSGKIAVIGASKVSEETLESIGEKLGIAKDRFEFHLDYETIKRYDYRKFEYASKYAAILFGPVSHSTSGKGDYSSTITSIEDKYRKNVIPAKVGRIGNSNDLKITKNSFEITLKNLISEGSLVIG
ncbi:MAG: hypothetical protein FWE49_00400 [Synergistaceae bacterium]|nr:hypothetical protein [Synergistaceae bacterium]